MSEYRRSTVSASLGNLSRAARLASRFAVPPVLSIRISSGERLKMVRRLEAEDSAPNAGRHERERRQQVLYRMLDTMRAPGPLSPAGSGSLAALVAKTLGEAMRNTYRTSHHPWPESDCCYA